MGIRVSQSELILRVPGSHDLNATFSIDDHVLRIERDYEPRGMLARVASYSAVSEGTLHNEVTLGYNAFSQQETDRQEHDGAVNDETTRRVAYTYADGAANTVRRTKIAYPSVAGSGWSYNGERGQVFCVAGVMARLGLIQRRKGSGVLRCRSDGQAGLDVPLLPARSFGRRPEAGWRRRPLAVSPRR